MQSWCTQGPGTVVLIMETLRPNHIVGLGGSAGSLVSFKVFLESLSPNTGMAFIIVSHLLPTGISKLGTILSRHTKMPVSVASNGLPILANHIYVISPNTEIIVDDFILNVISPPTAICKQVDRLLISLAETLGANAIAVIFSGYCNDGTEGCKCIKANGGLTFAQDLSAEIPSMPLNAQASGCIDFVLPPDKIAAEIERLIGIRMDHSKQHIAHMA
jgi:chemotaxis response regulator CheB